VAKTKTKTVKVTLTRSVIGEKPKNRATIEALGLRKVNQSVEQEDTGSLRGMLKQVNHLVEVEEA
jgi:large subunit ribosomal protein L30